MRVEDQVVRAEPFDSPFVLRPSKDERLAQEGPVAVRTVQ